MTTKRYKPHKLIDGKVIGQDGRFVAVPDKNLKDSHIIVEFEGQTMTIKNWHKAWTFRRFHDRFGGKDYTLGYFKWLPD